ncbi:NUDIX hydrolase [Parvularcula sp. ZS-1/3]|uniref:NUDIX hydrolase n=1 Tax=Parvularcula mediterranea TaxID=2732508 RepID=A0A7Y3W6Q4_9PROT|nr:NUDIX hydrolase [Parvularcula mediterranea]NNU17602.1 NUDIX hydrolase [Parvularcula mediterranea]
MPDQKPIVAVGGVVLKGDEVLLIKRGRPPLRKHWSIPGGKVEYGEPHIDALKREILEETGVICEPIGLIGVFEALPDIGGDKHFVMVDYACRYVSGEVTPGDDAMDAEFLPIPEALSRVAWDETRRAVQGALKFARD